MPLPHLFPEIGFTVIDQLGSENVFPCPRRLKDAHHLRALCNFSRSSRIWLLHSRINLYNTIYIEDRRGLESLRAAFTSTPHLRGLVRTIKIFGMDAGSNPVRLQDLLILMQSTLLATTSVDISYDNPHSIKINNTARACLSLEYQNVHQVSISNLSGSQVFHLLHALPCLRTLKCSQIQAFETRAQYELLPMPAKLRHLEVRSRYSASL